MRALALAASSFSMRRASRLRLSWSASSSRRLEKLLPLDALLLAETLHLLLLLLLFAAIDLRSSSALARASSLVSLRLRSFFGTRRGSPPSRRPPRARRSSSQPAPRWWYPWREARARQRLRPNPGDASGGGQRPRASGPRVADHLGLGGVGMARRRRRRWRVSWGVRRARRACRPRSSSSRPRCPWRWRSRPSCRRTSLSHRRTLRSPSPSSIGTAVHATHVRLSQLGRLDEVGVAGGLAAVDCARPRIELDVAHVTLRESSCALPRLAKRRRRKGGTTNDPIRGDG